MNVDDANEPSRSEKLAAAKKKLKHYQQRQKQPSNVAGGRTAEFEVGRPLSSAYSGCSTESLAESSKSLGVRHHQHHFDQNFSEYPKRYSVSSLPAGSGAVGQSEFHHDEHRSPFQRIKRPSESSECSSAVAYNVESYNYLGEKPKIMDRAFDEENGRSDDADALNSNKLKLVIEFNNSNHNENDKSMPSVTAFDEVNRGISLPPYTDSLQQSYSDSTKNENWSTISNASASTATVADNRPASYLEANSADYMPTNIQNNNNNRLAKIFNEIQPKIDAVSDSLNSNFADATTTAATAAPMITSSTNEQRPPPSSDSLNLFSENYFPALISDNSKFNIPPSDAAVDVSSSVGKTPSVHSELSQYLPTTTAAANNSLNMENIYLTERNQQLQVYCQQLSAQLHELNTHYAQLHAAYTNLNAEHSAKSNLHAQHLMMAMNQQENQNDLQKQIQQHLQTMSVLVEEKSELQSQLRQAMDIANKEHLENEELTGRLKANRERLTVLEKELETCSSVRTAIETTLQRQSSELERVRKESAQFQAKATDLQQDKSELSARLKVRSREVDDFLGRMRELEKQLQMKDIYIQQLTGGQQTVMVDEMERYRLENQRIQSELNEYRQLAERFKQEAEQSKERYESYGRQLNLKIVELSGELEKSGNERIDLENKLHRLEHEFQEATAKAKNVTTEQTLLDQQNSLNVVDQHEMELSIKSNAMLKEECQMLLGENSRLQSLLVEKKKVVESLEDILKEKDSKISRLEEFINTNDKTNSNVQSLLEQLHNEKATSSRAVAQNIALKTQLAEIEDKFVSVTHDEMEMATKLQTAEHAVQTLTTQLAEKDEQVKQQILEQEEKYNKLKSEINNMMKKEYDRTQFEDRLHHYEVIQKAAQDELANCRLEITRLNEENSSLQQTLTLCEEKLKKAIGENGDNQHISEPSVSNDDELTALQTELAQSRHRIDHLTTENAELHRIMEQNAADENQNTIHVELRQAVERMTTLSRDNEDYRRNAIRLRDQLTAANDEINRLNQTIDELRNANVSIVGNNGNHINDDNRNSNDDHSSVCSEHNEQRKEDVNMETFENMKKAMEQLQTRFTRAITENADLADHNEQLEHLIMQLQSETETIGEYVTLYQHQRKIIRDRLKEKEEYVARLSREKQEIQVKLSELQHLVMHLLKEKGALRTYVQFPPTHARPVRSPPSKLPERPRNLSETLVDETSSVSSSPVDNAVAVAYAEPAEELPSHSQSDLKDVVDDRSDSSPAEHVCSHHTAADVGSNEGELFEDTSPTAERILKLLVEMQRPDLANNLPPSERSLHCKYCTGKLLML